MSDPANLIPDIQTRKDLTHFVRQLAEDLRRNPDEWENVTLDSFLDALAAWTEDMDGYYRNTNQEVPANPQWKTIADMLMGASGYE